MRFPTALLIVAISSTLLPASLRPQANAPTTRVTVPLAGIRERPGPFAERIRFVAGDRGRVHTHGGDLHVVGIRGRLLYKPHFEWTTEPAEIHVEDSVPKPGR